MALVITGTQRSGTSVMAKMLIEMGVEMGGAPWDEEAQGGYEHILSCAFYRYYLGDPTFPWDDIDLRGHDPKHLGSALEPMFRHMEYTALKFSFLCMNPAFVYIWMKFRAGKDNFLVMHRNPEAVAQSKLRLADRFLEHDSVLLPKKAKILQYNFQTSVTLLAHLSAEYDVKVHVLPFPSCLRDKDMVDDALEGLAGLHINRGVWDSVVDLSRIHF